MSENPLFGVWCDRPAVPAPADPLAALETAIACLERGEPIPQPAAGLLRSALLRFTGGSRFDHALGLTGEPGKRSPVLASAKAQRDGKLRAIAELLPDYSQHDKALVILALLEGEPAPELPASETVELIAADLRTRRNMGWTLPGSVRQIERILSGE